MTEQQALKAAALEARPACFNCLAAMPWEAASRHLTELTIKAINQTRLAEAVGPLDDMNVTLGGLYGAFSIALVREDAPIEFVISDDQPVWDAWTSLATTIRQHCIPGRAQEMVCICR